MKGMTDLLKIMSLYEEAEKLGNFYSQYIAYCSKVSPGVTLDY